MKCPFLFDSADEANEVLASYCEDPSVIKKAFDASYNDLFDSITDILVGVENHNEVEHMGLFFDPKVFYHVKNDLNDALSVFQASPSKGYAGQLFEHPFFAHSSLPKEMIFVIGKSDGDTHYVGYASFDPSDQVTLGIDKKEWSSYPFCF